MKLIEAELRGTNRKIVTNFPLIKEELAQVCHDKYGESFDILTRVHIIEEKHELTNFYRIRGLQHEKETDWLTVEIDKKGKPIAYDITGAFDSGGVFYLLDEVHLVFGARDWQEMGRAVIYYASQHRKLGDDVILITQAPKNVDNQFRSLAQDYTVLRNHGMEMIGWFKQPDVFSRKTYLNLPNPGTKDTPLETSHFKLDLAWADCYETDRGVGIEKNTAGGADKGKDRRKGMRWYWFVGALVFLLGFLFWGVTEGIGGFFRDAGESLLLVDENKTEGNKTERLSRLASYINDRNSQNETVEDIPRQLETNVVTLRLPETNTNMVEGYLITNYRDKIRVQFRLSNGRVLQTGRNIELLTSNKIVDDQGITYKFRPGVYFDPREILNER